MKRSQSLGKKEDAGLPGPREEKEAQEEEMSFFLYSKKGIKRRQDGDQELLDTVAEICNTE